MKKTYDEILDSMRKKFFEVSGHSSDSIGDADARLQAVASELYSLHCFEDYSLKQSFVQTATGQYLDKHAELRNTQRKLATKASVKLTFGVDEPAEEMIMIPTNTICSCDGMPYIQFKTKTNGIIKPNETTVDITSEALVAGDTYNVDADSINTMVNPPVGVSYVINKEASKGGSNRETDEELRNRLKKSFSVPASGLTFGSIAEVVEKNEEVKQAKLELDGKNIVVRIRTASDTISSELESIIRNSLWVCELMGYSVVLEVAKKKLIDLTIKVQGEYEQIEDATKDWVKCLGIGENEETRELERYLEKIDGVKRVEVVEPKNVITINSDEYAEVREVEIQ